MREAGVWWLVSRRERASVGGQGHTCSLSCLQLSKNYVGIIIIIIFFFFTETCAKSCLGSKAWYKDST
jgi:hypothetical protein